MIDARERGEAKKYGFVRHNALLTEATFLTEATLLTEYRSCCIDYGGGGEAGALGRPSHSRMTGHSFLSRNGTTTVAGIWCDTLSVGWSWIFLWHVRGFWMRRFPRLWRHSPSRWWSYSWKNKRESIESCHGLVPRLPRGRKLDLPSGHKRLSRCKTPENPSCCHHLDCGMTATEELDVWRGRGRKAIAVVDSHL